MYEAEHLGLGRAVAVKVMKPELAGMKDLLARFDREARALSKLSHTNIVAVSDFGVWEGMPFLVMELVRGRILSDEVKAGPLGVERSGGVVRQILAALVYAHGQGVIHRDMKPQNVMLVAEPGITDLVKILDFGLAKFMGEEPADVAITREGAVFGTPAYMSPEQVGGDLTDERSDLYAVGLVLFECLAGRRPFLAESRLEIMHAHLGREPPRLTQLPTPEPVPQAIDDIVQKALAKSPKDRFASADEMLGALAEAVGWSRASLPGGGESSAPKRAVLPPPVEPAPAQPARPAPAPAPKRPRAPLRIPWGTLFLVATFAGLADLVWKRGLPTTLEPISAPVHEGGSLASSRPPARNPWSGRVPVELLRLRRDVARGKASALQKTKVFARDHRDPRAHLLVGHAYYQKMWLGDALERYETALGLDPGIRGEPGLLGKLVKILGPQAHGRRAAALIREVWGPEAVGALAEAANDSNPAVARAARDLWTEIREREEPAPAQP